jgi:hypothetical protein
MDMHLTGMHFVGIHLTDFIRWICNIRNLVLSLNAPILCRKSVPGGQRSSVCDN